MSDRTPPGIHDDGMSKKRPGRNYGCLALIVAPILLIGACTAISAMNRKPYDPDNPREAVAQCEAAVEDRLKAPSTASFDLAATGSGTWTVTGTVDAENGFGATVRNAVRCTVIVNDDGTLRVRVDQLG